MRRAELLMAITLGLLSAYLMWKSAELPIGWIEKEGPGAGAFPFWLAAGMLVCSLWTGVRWAKSATPPSRSEDPFMSQEAAILIVTVVAALTVMVGLVNWVGMYVSIPLFLLFYLRVIGKHSWRQTGSFVVATPIITFMFFEWALQKTLPKGITEPWFEPIYALIYG
jgi:putative tricarboxylic transport membrane protein